METHATDALVGISEPSEDEKENYFAGFAGSPRLVARTSTSPWSLYNPEQRIRKTMSTLQNHTIVGKWCQELRSALITTLNGSRNTSGVDWVTFFPIRIGERDELDKHKHPAVLLVALQPGGDHEWAACMRVALRCRALLQGFDVWDMDVEMLEGYSKPMASPAAVALASKVQWKFSQNVASYFYRNYETAKINGQLMPLLPFPGLRVEQEPGQPDAKSGTLGLYLRLVNPSSSESVLYGLTNRHVAVGCRAPADQDIRPSGTADQELPQLLSGGLESARTVSSLLADARGELRYAFRSTQNYFFRDPDSVYFSALHDLQRTCLEYAEDLSQDLEAIEKAETSQRLLGTLAYSPSYRIGKHGDLADWALIRLSDSNDALTVNKIYMAEHFVGTALSRAYVFQELIDERLDFQEPELDENGFLHLHGRDLPKQPLFYGSDRKPLLVAKRGQRTGLRFGVANEIEAVKRTALLGQGGDPVVSFHLIVLDWRDKLFSAPGDSGSCVFDCAGRVVGIMDSGLTFTKVVRAMKKHDPEGMTDLPTMPDIPEQGTLPEGFKKLTAKAVLGITETGSSSQNEDPTKDDALPEVTFVTPIQWLLEDIREYTGCEVEIV